MPRSKRRGKTVTRCQMFEWLQSRVCSLDCNEQITEIEKMRRDLAPKEHSEFLEIAGFASIAYFAKRYFPEFTRLPFGVHHTYFFNAIPRGERGIQATFLAPRTSRLLEVDLPRSYLSASLYLLQVSLRRIRHAVRQLHSYPQPHV